MPIGKIQDRPVLRLFRRPFRAHQDMPAHGVDAPEREHEVKAEGEASSRFFDAFVDELRKVARGGDTSPGYEMGGRVSSMGDTARSEDLMAPSVPKFKRDRLILRNKMANSVVYG